MTVTADVNPVAPPEAIRAPDRAAEASHRVANQLGQLAALLQRQIAAIQNGPDLLSRRAVVDVLRLHHGRLLGIAHLHRAIGREPDEDAVALGQALPELFREFQACDLFEDRLRLEWTFTGDCRVAAARASALALAFSEIVTNALKYAHPTGQPVELTVIAAAAPGGGVALTISDDGVGLPDGFDEACDAGVGLKLVRSLIESVGGRIGLSSNELGLTFHIELPSR